MIIDLVWAEPGFPPSSICVKPGWTLLHGYEDPTYLGLYRTLHHEPDFSIRLAVEFEQDQRAKCISASISVDRVTQQGTFMQSEELFCYPIPVNVAAAMCFARRFNN
jgi:hypothetical protein